MGDPKKIRKKYATPGHPWQKARIVEESELIKKYAVKNKKEIWKMSSKLKNCKDQAKKLSSLNTEQSEKEKEQLLKKLSRLGLLKPEDKLESILTLKIEDIMERRLQTIVMKRGLARSIKQARQFVTHGHIEVSGGVISSPSYIVSVKEEGSIKFKAKSGLADPDNPERKIVKAVEKKEEETGNQKKSPKKTKRSKNEERVRGNDKAR